MRGTPPSEAVHTTVRENLDNLRNAGVSPTLGTVLMSDDDGDVAFMNLKHERCNEAGIPTKRIDIPPDASPEKLYRSIERLGDDDEVTALFVQTPFPEHVDVAAIRDRVPPAKDIDCFAPENLGRLVAGHPRVTPPTPMAVRYLLAAYGIETTGQHVVVVGRTTAICKPLANMFLVRGPHGDATVTICHTATRELAAVTSDADILVTAAGVPNLVDESMVSAGVTIVDISVNRVETDTDRDYELVGDVDFESVRAKARAITPVPGGVGPLTLAFVLNNIVEVTARQVGVEITSVEYP